MIFKDDVIHTRIAIDLKFATVTGIFDSKNVITGATVQRGVHNHIGRSHGELILSGCQRYIEGFRICSVGDHATHAGDIGIRQCAGDPCRAFNRARSYIEEVFSPTHVNISCGSRTAHFQIVITATKFDIEIFNLVIKSIECNTRAGSHAEAEESCQDEIHLSQQGVCQAPILVIKIPQIVNLKPVSNAPAIGYDHGVNFIQEI